MGLGPRSQSYVFDYLVYYGLGGSNPTSLIGHKSNVDPEPISFSESGSSMNNFTGELHGRKVKWPLGTLASTTLFCKSVCSPTSKPPVSQPSMTRRVGHERHSRKMIVQVVLGQRHVLDGLGAEPLANSRKRSIQNQRIGEKRPWLGSGVRNHAPG